MHLQSIQLILRKPTTDIQMLLFGLANRIDREEYNQHPPNNFMNQSQHPRRIRVVNAMMYQLLSFEERITPDDYKVGLNVIGVTTRIYSDNIVLRSYTPSIS